MCRYPYVFFKTGKGGFHCLDVKFFPFFAFRDAPLPRSAEPPILIMQNKIATKCINFF